MRRKLPKSLLAVVVLAIAAIALGRARNPERLDLDAQARLGATGDFIELDAGTTHYEIAGPDTARLVVLVHGFSVPYYIWDSTFTALQDAGYRVLRYDLFGRGLSDRPDVDYDGALYDAQLAGLLDGLGVSEPVDLVGLSFGGFVTSHFVTTHPDRVRTLTMVDPSSETAVMPWSLRIPVLGPWLWQVRVVPGMADNQLSDFLHPEHHPTWPDQYRPQMRYRGFGRALLSTVETLSKVDFDTLFTAVAATGTPVLLIWGREDQTVSFDRSGIVLRNIPSAEFMPVDSAGHLPHIEQAQLVDARLVTFLEAHPAATGR